MQTNIANESAKIAIGKRIKEIRNVVAKGVSQLDFSKKYDITPYTKLSKIEIGAQSPNWELFYLLASEFEVNINWLLTGDGERFLTKSEYNMSDPIDRIQNKLEKELKMLKEKLTSLDSLKKKVEDLEKKLSDLEKKKDGN